MYIGLSEIRIAFPPNSSVLPHQYHYTSVTHSYLFHAPPTLQTVATDIVVKQITYTYSVGRKVIERRAFSMFFYFKQQDTVYVPNNRTTCMCQTTGHTVCAKQQDILYVPKKTSGEKKPDIHLRKYHSSDMNTGHFISVHTHTFISFGSDMLLYFHIFICPEMIGLK
jgi:hypothetical protein